MSSAFRGSLHAGLLFQLRVSRQIISSPGGTTESFAIRLPPRRGLIGFGPDHPQLKLRAITGCRSATGFDRLKPFPCRSRGRQNRPAPAPAARQIVAHGATVGFNAQTHPAPDGAKDISAGGCLSPHPGLEIFLND